MGRQPALWCSGRNLSSWVKLRIVPTTKLCSDVKCWDWNNQSGAFATSGHQQSGDHCQCTGVGGY